MNQFKVGDPSVTLQATPAFGGSVGWLRFLNYSPYALDLAMNRGTFRITPYTPRDILADVAENPIKWTIAFSLPGAATGASDLTIEAYDENEPRPPIPPGFACPLVNVGSSLIANQLGTGNDGIQMALPAVGALTGSDQIQPYTSAGPNPTRGLNFAVEAAGLLASVFSLLAAAGTGDATGLSAGDVFVGSGGVLGNGNFGAKGFIRSDAGNFKTDGALGTLATYGGLATAGLGVGAQRIKGDGVHITTTTANQTICTLTTPNDGNRHRYRVGGRVRVNNSVSGNNLTFRCAYTDFDSGGAVVVWFTGNPGSADVTFGGAASITNNVYSCTDRVIDCTPNTAITIQYTDPTNTPNDNVSGYIEQLT